MTRVLVVLGAAAAIGAVLGAAALATAVAVLLVAYVPLASRRSYRTLVFRVSVEPSIRARLYVSSIVLKWTFVGVIALVGAYALRGPSSVELWLGHAPVSARVLSIAFVVVVIAASVPAVLRLRHARPGSLQGARRQLQGAVALLPRTPLERRIFVAMAVTAGVIESHVSQARDRLPALVASEISSSPSSSSPPWPSGWPTCTRAARLLLITAVRRPGLAHALLGLPRPGDRPGTRPSTCGSSRSRSGSLTRSCSRRRTDGTTAASGLGARSALGARPVTSIVIVP